MGLKTNLGNYKNTFEPIPAGTQVQVAVEKADLTESEGKAPYVKTWFRVITGLYSGRIIFKNFIFTEKAIPFMKPFLESIGYPSDQDIEIEPTEWLHEQLIILVGHETYNGTVKEISIGYKSLESEGKTPIEKEEEIPF